MPAYLQHQVSQVFTEAVRLCVWLILLGAVFIPLEMFFGARRGQKRSGRLRDLGYYFLNNMVPGLIQVPILVFVGWGLHFLVPAQVYSFIGAQPLLLRLFAGLVIGDFFYYWGHRLMHVQPFLWRFHSVHHAAPAMDWLVSTRAHPVDIVFGHLCGLVPLYALGLAQPMAHKSDILPLLFVIVGTSWGFFIHANLAWRLGYLGHLVSTPGFHHWHHTKSGPLNKNFASLLPWLDRIFSTYHAPGLLPAEYGIEGPMPEDLVGQLLAPFENVKNVYDPLTDSGSGKM
jgi:sterol desaturase/sphingolipid hydroxylase (fatty acid hydroxylase superfamily)